MPEFLQYILAGLGLLVGISYAWGQIIKGRNERRLDTITILEKDVGILRSKVEELTQEVKKLREENMMERKKFAEAILAIQSGDTTMTEFIKSGNEYMRITAPVIETLKAYLNKQVI